ncbi:hypothetical protein [Pelagicoccus sp. SDUM812003]|uniref:hypothetical protein n=1 Tax=Pelagicoccus sp. SDUM812003 TaxID=3041267 RepID=UPI00280E01E6|nr:hypothetical protein [Pelagicoccus sp. SDUM812003]MDQ8202794.1 hypothetical protein [Pelagicoccus sp. SDUM812003]
MNSTDILQSLGILTVFLTFVGTVWIQEQRRRHDLLREKLEALIEHLHTIAWAPFQVSVELSDAKWDSDPDSVLSRIRILNEAGFSNYIHSVSRSISIADVYFHRYSRDLYELADRAHALQNYVKNGDLDSFLDTLKPTMNKAGSMLEAIHKDFASITKSTHIPSEL